MNNPSGTDVYSLQDHWQKVTGYRPNEQVAESLLSYWDRTAIDKALIAVVEMQKDNVVGIDGQVERARMVLLGKLKGPVKFTGFDF